MIIEIELNLASANADPLRYVNITGFDSVSIDAFLLQGSSFDSGVISVKKANRDGGEVSFDTPATITAPGLTELSLADWVQASFLVLECTTAASSAARVLLTIQLTKIGFKIT